MVNLFEALKKMSQNYETLLESGYLSDVVLVAGGKEIRVHKLILSAQSEVFAAMFAHSTTKEAQENRVEITDVDVEVVELLVRYIYTGKVEELGLYAAELFVAACMLSADKYQFDCLKRICERQLLGQITVESAAYLLLFGEMYQLVALYNSCLGFIVHNGTQVLASEAWKSNNIVARADLVFKLFERLNSKYSDLKNCKYYVYNSTQMTASKEFEKTVDKPVQHLVNICERLKLNISEQLLLCPIGTESVSNLFILADKHQATEVTAKCVEYITDNANEVMQQEEEDWKKVAVRGDLMVKLFKDLSLKYEKELKIRDSKYVR